ncbi:MAG: ABC transporter ATP-binding protein [Bacteroidaceae bacterium]|nr:ABC transporter ATP-binding protein [Bacteroidaceae bacterium]
MFIEVENVSKNYSGHVALNNVSLKMEDGSIYGLLGPNGAGKTSLIRIINRITHADSGRVLMRGKEMTDEDVALIGYLPEERGLYKKMKVGDQIVYLARLHGMTKNDATLRMREWLERFDLMEWENKKLEALSKGMAQKVQFIATVIHRPPLLIFDEPFSGFDPVNAEILKREILRLRDEGSAILFSTHNMASVEEVCEEISLINHAEIVLQGRLGEIRERYKRGVFEVNLKDGTSMEYKVPEGMSNHDAIALLNEKYDLVGFHEVLPSMQEIFIRTVQPA